MKIESTWPRLVKTLAGVMAAAVVFVGIPMMTVSATGDDYPFKGRPNVVDPWGFYTDYCTSFTAWRLSQAGIVFHGASLRGPEQVSELAMVATQESQERGQPRSRRGTLTPYRLPIPYLTTNDK